MSVQVKRTRLHSKTRPRPALLNLNDKSLQNTSCRNNPDWGAARPKQRAARQKKQKTRRCSTCGKILSYDCVSRKMVRKPVAKRRCDDCIKRQSLEANTKVITCLCYHCSEHKSTKEFSNKMLQKKSCSRRCLECTNRAITARTPSVKTLRKQKPSKKN